MQKMYPSADQLATYTVLQEGKLSLTEALKTLSELQHTGINIELPNADIALSWKEVRPRRTQREWAQGLTGDRLTRYYFQYFAEFQKGETPIEARAWQHQHHHHESEQTANCAEQFSTELACGKLANEFFADNKGSFNATWLLEFLSQPQRCLNAGETLSFQPVKGGFMLCLRTAKQSRQPQEVEEWLFNQDFSALQWEHHTYFK